MNHTIELPHGCNKDDVVIAFFNASHAKKVEGFEATAKVQNAYAWAIDAMNPEPTDVDLTDVVADCDCDGRDANEIPVYLTAEEIGAVRWALERITFGELDGIHSVVFHNAMKEVREASLR